MVIIISPHKLGLASIIASCQMAVSICTTEAIPEKLLAFLRRIGIVTT